MSESLRPVRGAGVLEDGKRTRSGVGMFQHRSVRALPAGISVHLVFDLWIRR